MVLTPRDLLLKAMADAIYALAECEGRGQAEEMAAAALEAIEARNAVVPIIPTHDQVTAGWIDKEDVNPDDIYRAMLAASPYRKDPQT